MQVLPLLALQQMTQDRGNSETLFEECVDPALPGPGFSSDRRADYPNVPWATLLETCQHIYVVCNHKVGRNATVSLNTTKFCKS